MPDMWSSMPPSDEPPAFRALYAAHRDDVWRYAARRAPDRDAADDVTAEVFVIAWRRSDSLPAEPLPWLYGVARRVLANHRRSETRRAALVERVGGETPAVHAFTEQVADRAALLAALATLSGADREVLMLVAWEGLTVAEVAASLGCRRGTAGVRLHRARQRLAAALSAAEPDARTAAPMADLAPSTSPQP